MGPNTFVYCMSLSCFYYSIGWRNEISTFFE